MHLSSCCTVVLTVTVTVVVVDLPRVTGLPPRVYLARGLTGRIDCPVDANPPVTIILWAKNGLMVNNDDGPGLIAAGSGDRTHRRQINLEGTLFIRSVERTDEGRYVCTPYSPLGKGQTSMPVQVFVRGLSKHSSLSLSLSLSVCPSFSVSA